MKTFAGFIRKYYQSFMGLFSKGIASTSTQMTNHLNNNSTFHGENCMVVRNIKWDKDLDFYVN